MSFAKLGEAEDASIRQWASRYGVLEAKEVASATWHVRIDDDGTRWQLGSAAAQLYEDREPIELWRILARRMRAILRIAAAFKGNTGLRRCLIHNGFDAQPEHGLDQDWEVLDWAGDGKSTEIVTTQGIFRHAINWWLTVGAVRPQLGMHTAGWNDSFSPWRIEMAYSGLVGGLAYRLLLMVIGEQKLYACDECGEPYIRLARAPQPGQENFCPNCPDAAQRRAIERHREGKRKPKKGKAK